MRLAFWRRKKSGGESSAQAVPAPVLQPSPDMIGLPYDMVPMILRTYNQDGLGTLHNTAFAKESDFAAAYAGAEKANSWGGGQIHWRAHVLSWAAHQAISVPGDYVECGTNRGGTAMLVTLYLGRALESRSFFLFDTFHGLDSSISTEDEMTRLHDCYPECYEEVAERFSSYKHVKVIRGTVPDVLKAHAPAKIAFLHVDLNAAGPERDAMEFLWPRLSAGALVVLDDYAWVACAAQKKTMDEFAVTQGVKILSLPTGQGLLIKPAAA